MRHFAALAVGLFTAVGAAKAQSCIAFEDAIQQASANFEDSPQNLPVIEGASPTTCDVATSLDGTRIYHCRWDHSYRAPEAIFQMAKMNTEIERCLGIASRKIEDGVNHPDTYEQRLYRLGDINISLSLKDKAAFNQSFVSLQISGVNSK
ncbi:MAG: hypothetical protein AAF557_08980 [Pseudomonadota bacterium]